VTGSKQARDIVTCRGVNVLGSWLEVWCFAAGFSDGSRLAFLGRTAVADVAT
jgi:hypothetical protein